MKPPRGVRQKHESRVGASLLAISIHAEPQDREQARSYEKPKHDSRVGASLLAITIRAEPQDREQARSHEERKHALRLYRVAFRL